jgi:D-3-phosphoglycerate dehydrogenase / 2-oxoglutarate reductase
MRGLRACADVIHVPGRRPTSSELRDVEVIVARSHVRIDSSLLQAAHVLKLIVRPGSGLDNVDLGECARRGVEVRRLGAGLSARSVAEFALAAALVLLRRLGVASHGLVRGEWLKHELLGAEIADRTVAIWGFGPVGAATAELFDAVGADVRVYTRSGRTGRFSSELSLTELTDWAHVHVLALPLTADTHGLVSEDVLRAMSSRAPLVINVSRWAVIDFQAALRALRADAISGLAIDPVDREHVPLVRAALEDSTLNLLFTPHVGANTEESLCRMGRAILEEVCTYLSSARDVLTPSGDEPQPPDHAEL